MDIRVRELVNEINETRTQTSASAKDEVRVMQAMLNDDSFVVDVYGNKGVKGYTLFTYIENGVTKEYRSDMFINESVRTLNLITKLNKSSHLYDFNEFDIVEV